FAQTLAFPCHCVAQSNFHQVIRMTRILSRRMVLSSLAMMPAALAIVAWSDSGAEAEAQTTAPAAPADGAKPATEAPAGEGSVDMVASLEPGALPDKVLGKAEAPVTIVEYASMPCPHCAHFNEATFPELKKNYNDAGKLRYIPREFPFDPRA